MEIMKVDIESILAQSGICCFIIFILSYLKLLSYLDVLYTFFK